jgi:hypothetical protein
LEPGACKLWVVNWLQRVLSSTGSTGFHLYRAPTVDVLAGVLVAGVARHGAPLVRLGRGLGLLPREELLEAVGKLREARRLHRLHRARPVGAHANLRQPEVLHAQLLELRGEERRGKEGGREEEESGAWRRRERT